VRPYWGGLGAIVAADRRASRYAGEADCDRKERLSMAYGAFAETKSRYRDLEALVDYRE